MKKLKLLTLAALPIITIGSIAPVMVSCSKQDTHKEITWEQFKKQWTKTLKDKTSNYNPGEIVKTLTIDLDKNGGYGYDKNNIYNWSSISYEAKQIDNNVVFWLKTNSPDTKYQKVGYTLFVNKKEIEKTDERLKNDWFKIEVEEFSNYWLLTETTTNREFERPHQIENEKAVSKISKENGCVYELEHWDNIIDADTKKEVRHSYCNFRFNNINW